MKKISFFLVLAMIGLTLSAFLTKHSEKAQFRVAAYNIRYAAPIDEESGNGWVIRKGPLASLIQRHQFDIVGTQEGDGNQMNDLRHLLPEFDQILHPYGGQGDLHNLGILYKGALFEPLDQGVFWLSETPDTASIGWDASDRRICQWVKFRHKASGEEFFFFNTHFYWRKEIARRESGPLVAAKIKEIAGDAPLMITGDFNSRPETPQIKDILANLKDAYDATESSRKGVEGTGFKGGVFQGPPGGRIDYIFVSPQVRVLDYEVLSDVYNGDRYPSDHLPVTSIVML